MSNSATPWRGLLRVSTTPEANLPAWRASAITDFRYLVAFRVAFGLCLAAWAGHILVSGAIGPRFLDPELHFHYPGFSWVNVPSRPAVLAILWGLLLSGLGLAAGVFYRVSAVLSLLLFTTIVLWERADYNNHYYFVVLLGCLFACCPVKGKEGPAWVRDLFRYQFILVYVFAGVAKWNADWLVGEPLHIWLSRRAVTHQAPWLAHEEVALLFAYGGLLLDLVIAPGLLWRPTRIPALLCLAAFHLTNNWLFEIGIFPPLMVASSIIFLGPTTGENTDWSSRPAKLARVWLLVQLLIPLRHLLIPGDVAWTEEGHLYSWRMMLRSKRVVSLRIQVGDEPMLPYPTLTLRQAAKMGGRPQMLQEFARYLSEKNGGKPVRIRSHVSLNGRPPQPIVDPNIDLAHAPTPWLLGHAPWITPLEQPGISRPTRPGLLCLTVMAALWALVGVLTWAIGVRQFSSSWLVWSGLGSVHILLLAAYAFTFSPLVLTLTCGLEVGRLLWTERRLGGHPLGRCHAALSLAIFAMAWSLLAFQGLT